MCVVGELQRESSLATYIIGHIAAFIFGAHADALAWLRPIPKLSAQ